MHSKILCALVAFALSALAPAQWTHNFGSGTDAVIPPSGSGGAANACLNPANTTVVAMVCVDAVKVRNVSVSMNLHHTYAHDLRITVSHGGIGVILFDQYPATAGLEFNGSYQWSDDAGVGIGAAIIPNQPSLQGGFHLPQSPLSAFDGLSGAGPWTIEYCDLAAGDTGLITDCGVTFQSGMNLDQTFPTQSIPDGGANVCLSPVTKVVNVPPNSGPVANLVVGINSVHQRAADIGVTVSHGPVSVTLCSHSASLTSPQLGGQYFFNDAAGSTWAAAVTYSGWQPLPGGPYRPENPLSAFDGIDSSGLWFVSVCDESGGGLVGTLSGIYFWIDFSGFRFEVSQPSGSSSIVLKNLGGIPGRLYVNAFTLAPGAYPYGWLNGLDIAMADLVAQVSIGAPYSGVLDANGSATTTIPGPIPQLSFQYVSFELDLGASPIASIPAASFTTVP